MGKAEKIITALLLAAVLLAVSYFTVGLPQYEKITAALDKYDSAQRERDAVYALLKEENLILSGGTGGAEIYDSPFYHELESYEADEIVRGILKYCGIAAENLTISGIYEAELSEKKHSGGLSYPLKEYSETASGTGGKENGEEPAEPSAVKLAAIDVTFTASGTRKSFLNLIDRINQIPETILIKSIAVPYTVPEENIQIKNNSIVSTDVSLTLFCAEPLKPYRTAPEPDWHEDSAAAGAVPDDIPDITDTGENN